MIKKYIQEMNEIYHIMNKNYNKLKKIFKNHTFIKQKIILSEQYLIDAYRLSSSELKEKVEKNEFFKIIKGLR